MLIHSLDFQMSTPLHLFPHILHYGCLSKAFVHGSHTREMPQLNDLLIIQLGLTE